MSQEKRQKREDVSFFQSCAFIMRVAREEIINVRGEKRDASTEGMMEHHVCMNMCVMHRLLYDVCSAKQMVAESENREGEGEKRGKWEKGRALSTDELYSIKMSLSLTLPRP